MLTFLNSAGICLRNRREPAWAKANVRARTTESTRRVGFVILAYYLRNLFLGKRKEVNWRKETKRDWELTNDYVSELSILYYAMHNSVWRELFSVRSSPAYLNLTSSQSIIGTGAETKSCFNTPPNDLLAEIMNLDLASSHTFISSQQSNCSLSTAVFCALIPIFLHGWWWWWWRWRELALCVISAKLWRGIGLQMQMRWKLTVGMMWMWTALAKKLAHRNPVSMYKTRGRS